MGRPTLVKQLSEQKRRDEIAKLSDKECIRLLLPHTLWQHIDFWVFCHLPFLHWLFWGAVCWVYPYNMETHTRHWRWDKGEIEN